MATFLNFKYLKYIAEATAKEEPKTARFIDMDGSEINENTEVNVFTSILHTNSKAAERVLKNSYAFAADPRVKAEVDEYTTDEGQSWKTITYHYNEEFEDQIIACCACIVLIRR